MVIVIEKNVMVNGPIQSKRKTPKRRRNKISLRQEDEKTQSTGWGYGRSRDLHITA